MTTTESPREQVERMFPVDGPHSPEATVAAAGAIAHLVRYLNYATSRGRGLSQGVPYPGTAYDVIGNLCTVVERLPQLITQTGERLRELAELPNAAQNPDGDERWPARPDPEATAWAVWAALAETHDHLSEVAAMLSEAQVYAGRLYLTGDDE